MENIQNHINTKPKIAIGVLALFSAGFFMYAFIFFFNNFLLSIFYSDNSSLIILILFVLSCVFSFLVLFLSGINYLSGNNFSKNKTSFLVFGLLSLAVSLVSFLLLVYFFLKVRNVSGVWYFQWINLCLGLLFCAIVAVITGIVSILTYTNFKKENYIAAKPDFKKVFLAAGATLFAGFLFFCFGRNLFIIIRTVYQFLINSSSDSLNSLLDIDFIGIFIHLFSSVIFIIAGIYCFSQKPQNQTQKIALGILLILAAILLFIYLYLNISSYIHLYRSLFKPSFIFNWPNNVNLIINTFLYLLNITFAILLSIYFLISKSAAKEKSAKEF